MDDLPGSLNIGLITFVSKAPTNSNNPWLSNNGKNKPAKKNTETNRGKRLNKTIPPVESDHINSGANLKYVSIDKIIPIILPAIHIGVTLNNEFKILLSVL